MRSSNHVQFETNIDDMDPRLWPRVIDRLLAAGAQDAWITPIVMKKGRPAHTLSALCAPAHADAVRAAIFSETTTLGLRELPITKWQLDRQEGAVSVAGQTIRTKLGFEAQASEGADAESSGGSGSRGGPTNLSVEWDDVAAAADALGLTAKQVLAAASAAAYETVNDKGAEAERC